MVARCPVAGQRLGQRQYGVHQIEQRLQDVVAVAGQRQRCNDCSIVRLHHVARQRVTHMVARNRCPKMVALLYSLLRLAGHPTTSILPSGTAGPEGPQ